jgi:hypothetical protein
MITPYQYREIEDEYPVEVYRNVTKKGVVYSIRQHGPGECRVHRKAGRS